LYFYFVDKQIFDKRQTDLSELLVLAAKANTTGEIEKEIRERLVSDDAKYDDPGAPPANASECWTSQLHLQTGKRMLYPTYLCTKEEPWTYEFRKSSPPQHLPKEHVFSVRFSEIRFRQYTVLRWWEREVPTSSLLVRMKDDCSLLWCILGIKCQTLTLSFPFFFSFAYPSQRSLFLFLFIVCFIVSTFCYTHCIGSDEVPDPSIEWCNEGT
jgi:hypothetical protein